MAMRAITTFHLPARTVYDGDVLGDDDPIVVKYPQFFADPNELTARVETAVAVPGEKRGSAPRGSKSKL